MELEPYQIIRRNDALYLAAFNPAKSRRSDEEPRLGHFNIAGMKQVELAGTFEPDPVHMHGPDRPDDTLLFAVN